MTLFEKVLLCSLVALGCVGALVSLAGTTENAASLSVERLLCFVAAGADCAGATVEEPTTPSLHRPAAPNDGQVSLVPPTEISIAPTGKGKQRKPSRPTWGTVVAAQGMSPEQLFNALPGRHVDLGLSYPNAYPRFGDGASVPVAPSIALKSLPRGELEVALGGSAYSIDRKGGVRDASGVPVSTEVLNTVGLALSATANNSELPVPLRDAALSAAHRIVNGPALPGPAFLYPNGLPPMNGNELTLGPLRFWSRGDGLVVVETPNGSFKIGPGGEFDPDPDSPAPSSADTKAVREYLIDYLYEQVFDKSDQLAPDVRNFLTQIYHHLTNVPATIGKQYLYPAPIEIQGAFSIDGYRFEAGSEDDVVVTLPDDRGTVHITPLGLLTPADDFELPLDVAFAIREELRDLLRDTALQGRIRDDNLRALVGTLFHRMSDEQVALALSIVASRPWSPGGARRTDVEKSLVEISALGSGEFPACGPWQCSLQLIQGYAVPPDTTNALYQGERRTIRLFRSATVLLMAGATDLTIGSIETPQDVVTLAETVTAVDSLVTAAQRAGIDTSGENWIALQQNRDRAFEATQTIAPALARRAIAALDRQVVPEPMNKFLEKLAEEPL